MEADLVSEALRESLLVAVKLGSPVLLAALAVGVVVSLFQAVTQINEASLAFLPKMAIVLGGLYFTGPFMLTTLSDYMRVMLDRMVAAGGL